MHMWPGTSREVYLQVDHELELQLRRLIMTVAVTLACSASTAPSPTAEFEARSG